ncbi:MAG: hypothetical protein OHK0019_34610 [Saprospiraceae bacterium]
MKAQNPPCQAYAAPSSWSSNGTVTITAYDSSAFPVNTYLWNTGATTEEITVTAAGDYCVTATNTANGGTTVACTWVQPDNACYAQINSVQLNSTTVLLGVTGGSDLIVSYAWSTGDNTPTTEVTESGQHGVTDTNAAGCTVSAYRWIFRANDYLGVQVILPDSLNVGNNGVHADIYLIKYDPAQGGILTAIDTAATYSWTNSWAFVSIQNVPPGEYLVKAALKPNSSGYDEHLPTYYGGALLWSDATPVVVNAISGSYSTDNIYIPLVPGQNPGGPGFIGGFVNQGANFAGFAGNNEAESLGEGDRRRRADLDRRNTCRSHRDKCRRRIRFPQPRLGHLYPHD